MIMTIQKYSINVVYHPGKQLVIADTLSRAFLLEQSDDILEEKKMKSTSLVPANI